MARGILYDLDGTTIDSYERIIEGFVRTFAAFGRPQSRDLCRPYNHWEDTIDKEGIDRGEWFAKYEEVRPSVEEGIREGYIKLFPDTTQTLHRVAAMGLEQAVITRNSEKEAMTMIEHFGLLKYMSGKGIYLAPISKNQHQDKISQAVDAILDMADQGPITKLYVVGDHEYDDVGTGLGLKVKLTIPVTTVFVDRWHVGESRADHIIRELDELVDVIQGPQRRI